MSKEMFKGIYEWGYFSVATKALGATEVLTGLAIEKAGRATMQGLTIEGPNREIIAAGAFAIGIISLWASLGADVIVGAKVLKLTENTIKKVSEFVNQEKSQGI